MSKYVGHVLSLDFEVFSWYNWYVIPLAYILLCSLWITVYNIFEFNVVMAPKLGFVGRFIEISIRGYFVQRHCLRPEQV